MGQFRPVLVLILVLMEWLQAVLSTLHWFDYISLNPCSDGMASSYWMGQFRPVLSTCLNPCSDGMASSKKEGGKTSSNGSVLILVLMEWLQASS